MSYLKLGMTTLFNRKKKNEGKKYDIFGRVYLTCF